MSIFVGMPAADQPTRPLPAPPSTSLGEIARLFLKLGVIGFGGPAAHIAMMEDEVVRKRGWLTREEFVDYLGATNLIPGPNSTELAIHVGQVRAGWRGLLLAGACFILPAATIVGLIAWAYVRFAQLPAFVGILAGVKPVVIGIVLQALIRLLPVALRGTLHVMVAVAVVVAMLLGVNEIALLALAGIAMLLARRAADNGAGAGSAAGVLFVRPSFTALTSLAVGSIASVSLWPLFGAFLKVGSVIFGSGYVLLAFLRADFVERLGWLTERQLLDAVAVGQVTPGPLFTTATFIGYLLHGTTGAAAATVGIFLPAFFFVAISGPLIPRLRASPSAGAVLDGVNVASLALMAVTSFHLARAAIADLPSLVIGAVAALLLFRFRVNSAWLVLGGAACGALVQAFR